MTVYAEVIAWSKTLCLWQQDALRRVATQASLSTTDIAELASASIAEASKQAAVPALVPLDHDHVPSCGSTSGTVALRAVAAIESVNAISDGQSLTFGTTGLTAIYGDNGAGKSGFARVLRSACQARGAAAAVLPSVYSDPPGVPGARIEYLTDGGPRSFAWAQNGSPPPVELRTVAIFDTGAATALVEQENEVLWTPAGLDLLVRLTAVIGGVRDELRRAQSAVAVRGPLPQVPTSTTAAAFLKRLSETTVPAELDAFVLSPEEQEELKRLDAALAVPDPAAAAAQLRRRVQRFTALRERVVRLEEGLGEIALCELSDLRTKHRAAVEAEVLLARTTFEGSSIPGVGDAPWRTLWDAAESYARSGATADGRFPSAEPPGLCVLCQQPLSDAARGRLERFRDFVRADVARRRIAAAEALRRRITQIRGLRVREPADGALIEELTTMHAEDGARLSHFLDAAGASVATIASLTTKAADSPLPRALPAGWAVWLDTVTSETEKRAAALLDAAAPERRAAASGRRQELLARQTITAGRSLVVTEMRRLARRAVLEAAVATCATNRISRKAGELTRAHVSDRLMAAFGVEAKALRLPVTVKYCHSRNEKGTAYQRVLLEAAPWAGRTGRPVRVLSEGERKAVALAAFLAELAMREDRSGVVFDDPVSSLDHERRRVVGNRLAKLAAERQVVVLTHDLVFLQMLKTAADKLGVPVTDREIRQTAKASGLCRDKAPVKAMRVKALVGELKERHRACEAAHGSREPEVYETRLANTFGLLREAWERAAEELLLNQAVTRFDYRVQTQRLKRLHDITKEDLATIEDGMSICSKWLPGHALAPAMNEPLPEPAELLAEIERLEGFVKAMRKRGRS